MPNFIKSDSLIKFEFADTPHSTYRLYIDRAIVHNEASVKLLNWLSCWGGSDKLEDSWPGFDGAISSWEFPKDLPREYVERAIRFPIEV